MESIYIEIEKAKNGDSDSLKEIFKKLDIPIRGMAKKYYASGVDRDDNMQIAMIGIYEGIKNYDRSFNRNPISFLKMCAERELKDMVKYSNKDKRKILGLSDSLDAPVKFIDNEKIKLKDVVMDEELLDDVINRNEIQRAFKEIVYPSLSKKESDSLKLYMEGYTLSDISKKLDLTNKQVDNVIQRVKRKIKANEKIKELYLSE